MTQARICAYVDGIGRLYCVDCLHRYGRLEEVWARVGVCVGAQWTCVYSDAAPHCEEACEGCGRVVAEVVL
jgi:hypothetical protein